MVPEAARPGVSLLAPEPTVDALQEAARGTALIGRISDGDTPESGAIVTISNRGFVKSTTTDGNGQYMLALTSPLLAVRAVIVQEFRGNAPAEA